VKVREEKKAIDHPEGMMSVQPWRAWLSEDWVEVGPSRERWIRRTGIRSSWRRGLKDVPGMRFYKGNNCSG
jgi:hypothetical protein